jgi:hypothetical protein
MSQFSFSRPQPSPLRPNYSDPQASREPARESPSRPMSPTPLVSMADTACAAADLFLGVRAVHATPSTPPPPYEGRAAAPCTPCASIRRAQRLAPLAGTDRTTAARSSTGCRSIRRVQESLDHSTTTRSSRTSGRASSASPRRPGSAGAPPPLRTEPATLVACRRPV